MERWKLVGALCVCLISGYFIGSAITMSTMKDKYEESFDAISAEYSKSITDHRAEYDEAILELADTCVASINDLINKYQRILKEECK